VANQTLSKAALGEARARLAGYRRFLPSLDLKRRQLIAERNKARARVAAMEAEREALFRAAGEAVPMLAFGAIGLEGLARLQGARYGQENVVGVILPVVEHVEVEIRAYGLLVRPHWVDRVAAMLVAALRLEVELAGGPAAGHPLIRR
jgi:V/A-type H+/Na+-transporting ATPase subunit D